MLTDDEARQLLVRRLGADRVAAEPAAVAEIITRCAHLPLALVLVAAHAAIRPNVRLQSLAEELRDTQPRWEALTGDDPTSDVRAVFSWSYRALTPAAARLFRLLGLHPGPDIAAPAVASLAGVPTTTVRPLLAELTRASLLVEHTSGRYTFHDLLRAYATDLARTTDLDQHCDAATNRILDHYLHTAYTADRLLDSTRDPITLATAQPGVTPQQPSPCTRTSTTTTGRPPPGTASATPTTTSATTNQLSPATGTSAIATTRPPPSPTSATPTRPPATPTPPAPPTSRL